ncbi:2-hydroxyglutaryl-CoA dehydratase [Candidatus Fermentibacteria bacterium]|nr:2-hydroxyglutaryl-CoA dehydratase [Candidatus Fermentibacteria bacterium]
MIYCGVDIGARSTEVILFDGAQMVEQGISASGHRPSANAQELMDRVLATAGMEACDLAETVATGYGRNYFRGADRVLSEIISHAMGVVYLFPEARTVIDIGGQDSKMIHLDENGRAVDFTMNDRCAAGTGKFIEMTGQTLDVSVDEMGQLTRGHTETAEISSMCAVFAESEIVGLLQSGTAPETILRGVFRSVAARTLAMAGPNAIRPELIFTGGVAMNGGVVRAMAEETGLEIIVPPEPRITGALGAAIAAFRG